MEEIVFEYVGLQMVDVSAGQYKYIFEEIMVVLMLR